MKDLQLRNGICIGAGRRPYIIAELNSSHNGSIEAAKQMIAAAKECGCDCVKLQSWSAQSLYCDAYYDANPITKRIVSKFSLSSEEIAALADYSRSLGIDLSSTPYSREEVDLLADTLGVPFIKIASMEINNLPFLRYIAAKGLPMILSTGMAEIGEVQRAVAAIEETGNTQLCILHCVSVYPAAPELVNLNNLRMLAETFPNYPVGYSDHTLGCAAAAAATALGAAVIEKHFTLDRTKMGMDNNMATEPAEMQALVEACTAVSAAMGSYARVLSPQEQEMKLKMRRSIVAARDIPAGTVITEDDCDFKRPGDGLSPDRLCEVLGKTACADIRKGYPIRREQLGA